jgi:predicted nucleotidyltransferase
MRNIPESMDAAIVEQIDERLDGVAREHDVVIPWAIESGSRAWGFPSPDSDYDCRFLYLRQPEEYLSLWSSRDVIETPLDEIFDVNGWDLAKALRLLVKGNAVISEWLRSPIVYSGDEAFRDSLLDLAEDVSDRVLLNRHYLHVGRRQWSGDTQDVSLKKVFYALRPATTLLWLRSHPESVLAPMNLHDLLAETEVADSVLRETAELTALKAVTSEMGRGTVPPAIAAFVIAEFERAEADVDGADLLPRSETTARVNEYFRSTLQALHA